MINLLHGAPKSPTPSQDILHILRNQVYLSCSQYITAGPGPSPVESGPRTHISDTF
jgi:hypothetical protein